MLSGDRVATRSGRRASQRADELLPFIRLLKREGVRSYLEIGARHGDTFDTVMRSLPPGSTGVAVDLPGGNWGVRSSQASLIKAVRDLRRAGYRAWAQFGNSRDPEIIAGLRVLGAFDAVLIDGDHLYEGVRADWENIGPLARLVAFHDIAGEGERTRDDRALPVEVPRLWRELKPAFRHVEFVGPGSTMGIGVLYR